MPMALSDEYRFLRGTEVRRYRTEPSLRLLTECEQNFIAEGSGVATVEFCNHRLQSVKKKLEQSGRRKSQT